MIEKNLNLVLFNLHMTDNILSIFQMGEVEAFRGQGTCLRSYPAGSHSIKVFNYLPRG